VIAISANALSETASRGRTSGFRGNRGPLTATS
jgi:hypothetical protein